MDDTSPLTLKNKIRCSLLGNIFKEISGKAKASSKNNVLINSLTFKELNSKFNSQKSFSIKRTEEFFGNTNTTNLYLSISINSFKKKYGYFSMLSLEENQGTKEKKDFFTNLKKVGQCYMGSKGINEMETETRILNKKFEPVFVKELEKKGDQLIDHLEKGKKENSNKNIYKKRLSVNSVLISQTESSIEFSKKEVIKMIKKNIRNKEIDIEQLKLKSLRKLRQFCFKYLKKHKINLNSSPKKNLERRRCSVIDLEKKALKISPHPKKTNFVKENKEEKSYLKRKFLHPKKIKSTCNISLLNNFKKEEKNLDEEKKSIKRKLTSMGEMEFKNHLDKSNFKGVSDVNKNSRKIKNLKKSERIQSKHKIFRTKTDQIKITPKSKEKCRITNNNIIINSLLLQKVNVKKKIKEII